MKVYLAAPYRKKDTIRACAEELRARDIVVTSRWLDEPDKPTGQLSDTPPETLHLYAIHDIADVVAADILVLWTDPTKSIIRQGRTVELGMVLGLNAVRKKQVPVFVVGLEDENIFHHAPEVLHFEFWDEVCQHLFALASKE